MAKRYYNLEKETKNFLKRMEQTRGVLPDSSGIQRLNDYIVKRKGLGLIFSTTDKIAPSFIGGSAEKLRITSNSSLQVKPEWEVAAWCFPRSSNIQEVVSKASNTPWNFEFSLRYVISGFVHAAATGSVYSSTTTVNASLNNWHFLRLGRAAATNNIFISLNNNTPVTASQPTQAISSSSEFNIGNWNDNGRPFNGLVDSVGRWDRLLTAAEYTFLYNSGRGVSFFEVVAYQPSLLVSLVSFWQLSESSGVRYDWWGNNHMTPTFTLTTTKGNIEKFF